jgi:hypothetical protein
MSIFKKQTLVAAFPAYNVFEREACRDGYVNITADDILAVDSGRGFHRTYSPGSVASYALRYNECPIEAVEAAREKGHALRWINGRATCLSAHAQAAENVVLVRVGMLVRFEGFLATIQPDHNNNIRLAAVEPQQKAA